MRASERITPINKADPSMTREEAADFYEAGHGSYYFEEATSRAGSNLASALRGGKKADPNVGPAIRFAEELERRLVTISVLRAMPPAPEPASPRPAPPIDDLPALLSSAGSDSRYVKRLLSGGAAMPISYVTEALRVVRGLRSKLEAAWALYEAMPKPERINLTSEQQAEFWRRLEAGMSEEQALDG